MLTKVAWGYSGGIKGEAGGRVIITEWYKLFLPSLAIDCLILILPSLVPAAWKKRLEVKEKNKRTNKQTNKQKKKKQQKKEKNVQFEDKTH
jgi:hypothetical protein